MHARRGFTLLELMLATAATAVIALAGAGMISALTYASSEQRDLRAIVGKSLTVGERLGAEIREARAIVGVSNDLIILWQSDLNDDGLLQLSELIIIEHNPDNQTLETWTIAPGSLDLPLDLALDLPVVTELYKALPVLGVSLSSTNWAYGVSDFQVETDNLTPIDVGLVSYRITFSEGSLSETFTSAAAIRDGGS